MKIVLIFLVIAHSNAFAFRCEENSTFGSLSNISGPNCLTQEVPKDELELYMAKKDEALDFCQGCKNPLWDKILEHPDAKTEKNDVYAGAVLDEFQKELSFITMDLMRLRSSYKLDFDPSGSVKSCDFDKGLKKPACLSEKQSKELDNNLKKIKNSLANELVNILGPSSNKDNGLFARRPNECNLNNTSSMNAHMMYLETLMTPKLVESLKSLQIPAGTSLNDFIKGKNIEVELKQDLSQLSMHPLFQILLKDTSKLNSFVKDVSEKESSHIISELYSSKYASTFGESIQNRCENVFKKTSKYLNEVLCKESPVYVADDLNSMQAVSGSTFNSLNNKQAEDELRIHCSNLNNAPSDATSFNKIRSDINGENDIMLSGYPISEFKRETYAKMFLNMENGICHAQKDKSLCISNPSDPRCKMLHYLELSKNDKNYQELASTSNDNINLILRSLVGNGLPQNSDGSTNQASVTLLQSEGILPGGKMEKRPQPQDASSFHKLTNFSSPKNKHSDTLQAPEQANTTTLSPGSHHAYANSNLGQTVLPDEVIPQSVSNVKKDPAFSGLSAKEQDALMNRFGKLPKKTTPAPTNLDAPQNEGDNTFHNPSFPTSQLGEPPQTAQQDNTSVVNRNIASIPENKAVLDNETKKNDALNQALIGSQEFIASGGAATQLPSSPSTVVSQATTLLNTDGENEIKIKVDESELKNVTAFNKELERILDSQRPNLADAKDGEKFVVKLGKYKINLLYDNNTGSYRADCDNTSPRAYAICKRSIPNDYLQTLSKYFTSIKNDRSGLDYVKQTIQQVNKQK